MKTLNQIDQAIIRLKENKSKTKRMSGFGEDNHRALDCMIKTLESNWDEYDIEDKFPNDADYENANSIIQWRNSDTENIEDFVYPE